ncbi:hypothetical protein HPB47_021469 [Ixodes persulcatus]|uniref:Uncharacterized protein n=1 Tax=Ixodes persulcatus TaxID=34615 RepID=A0AC60QCP4_IXOPE|nr:hypothetical protein HPB47_021469 [Ixodes persulcatus]
MEETWMRKFEEMREKMKDDEDRQEAVEQKLETQVEQMREKSTKKGEWLEVLQAKWEDKLKEADERTERESPFGEEEKEVILVENNRDVEAKSAGEEEYEANPAGKNRKVDSRGAVIEDKKAKSSKVGGEEGVKVRTHPGKCLSEVMKSAKNIMWDKQQKENLSLGRQLEAGVRKFREAAEKVHIVMCTIPVVQRQAWGTKRRVVEANKVIKKLAE